MLSGGAAREPERFITQSSGLAIGRSAECDLLLSGPTVSRVHCVVKRVSSGYLIEDCSRNGTWVNGIRVRSCLLRDGDQVRIGSHTLHVELVTARPTSQATGRETGSGYLPRPDLERAPAPQVFVRGLEEGVTLSLCGEEISIGRHPGNDIQLDCEKVSREHTLIRRCGSILLLVDLGSVNGTCVNGFRVERSELKDGDLLRIGDYLCQVCFRGQDCLLQFRKRNK